VTLLLVEVGMRVALDISETLSKPSNGSPISNTKEHNATNRQRTNKEKYENRCVLRGKQPEARERDRGQPSTTTSVPR
jgi:hypothetical protein